MRLEETRRARLEEEIRRRRQTGLEPLFFGLNPIRADDELSSSPPRVGRIPIRGQTASPSHTAIHSPLRTEHSSPKSQISHLHTQSNPSGRSASVPPRPSPKHTQSSQARPLSTQQPQATSTPQEPPKPSLPAPTPEQLEAASKVFEFYRSAVQRRRALTTLRDLRARFLGLRSNFTFPAVVDFECPAGYDGPTMGELGGERYVRIEVAPEVTSIFASGLPRIQEEDALVKSAPKLAYTPVNAPLHSHEEELNRLLGALDAVESHGIARVRDARRRLVRAVEHEAERLEKWREAIWATFVERRTQQPQPEQKEEVAAEETTKDVEKMVLEEPKLEETQFEEMQPADASQPEAADSESPGRPQQEQDPAAQPEGVSIEVIEPDEPKHTEDVDIEPEPVSAPVPVNEDFIHPESSVAATADADMKADEPEQGVTVDVHTAVPSEAVSEAGDDADIDIDGDNEGEGEQMEVEESVRVPEKDVDAIDAEPIQLEPGPAEHEMEVEPQEHADSGMPTLVNTTVPSIPGSPYPSLLEQPAVTESASEPVLSTFVPSPTPTPSYPSIPIYTTSNSRSEPADVDVDVDLELDTETEAETERGPSTPPPASAFGYPEAQSPVVVVSPAGSYREQFALGNEDKFLQLAEPPKEHIETAPAHPQSENQQPALSLVDRDWKEVEGFDMF
ncbi:hypothetical protein CERSUDRAFT_116609 [Gelatoporia subvermispora B]|uniref:BAG domain-containing protein n=1 Tax=Ceriporiopsis subvermispora (strain B) TaxID=914234 RepID=M2PGJ2_CERS8|nr:hypothetical protein CERSUDRAFT_116609 [Gelatoporia subvermispora B]